MFEKTWSSSALPDGKLFGRWQMVLTEDGSPSFCKAESVENLSRSELMHHRGGAFGETLYIYGPPVRNAFTELKAPWILSLGLGLGYNELLTAEQAVLQGKNSQFKLTSFESESDLREAFLDFVFGRVSPFAEVYRAMISRFSCSEESLKACLAQAYQEGTWQVKSALTSPEEIEKGVHVFLWDAFSQKTSPELWAQDFLEQALSQASPEAAWISSYACNGALKRALKSQGFSAEIRPGFKGKRECTWGRRGLFLVG